MAERHIVIVGGGFTGTALAIHLARRGAAGLQVTVIEPRPALARGVAYGTKTRRTASTFPPRGCSFLPPKRASLTAGIAPRRPFRLTQTPNGRMAKSIRSAGSSGLISPSSSPKPPSILL
ncbi:Uncharacterized protein conserved in bacteria [Ewingella americana]|uniref:Uncharacterized protein conserved in bacteria n=1 Tax=Ewingella americana TaxID=41202 RepID=A0A377NG72_9GAMM|nr:Uncharacterized protein conserved in bacteria [Ewingella americana]